MIEELANIALMKHLSIIMEIVWHAQMELTMTKIQGNAYLVHLTLSIVKPQGNATAPIISPITMAQSALSAEIIKSGTTTEESASTAQVTDLSSRTVNASPAQPALIMTQFKGFVFPAHPTLSIAPLQENVIAQIICHIMMALSV